MKNMTWRDSLIFALAFWSAATQANTLGSSGDIQIYPGGNIELQTGQTLVTPQATQPPRIAAGDIQISPRGAIEIQANQTPNNSASIASSAIILPTEPAFWALNQTSSLTQIGDYFDIEVIALVPLTNANPDELVLGFGFNAQFAGTGAAQFLGSTISPLFTDISNQDGVNLAAAGIAFPGLGFDDVGSLISLAVLHFQAITAGNLDIAITSDLNDPNQGLIYLTQAPLAIQANNSVTISAVPLPAAWLLFLPGIGFCLRGFARKPV